MNEIAETSLQPYKPRVILGIRRGVGDYYDRLGLTAAGSFALALALLVGLVCARFLDDVLPRPAATTVSICLIWFLTAYAWAGNMLIAHRIAYAQEPSLAAFLDVFKEYRVGLVKLAGIELLVTTIVAVDILFFLAHPSLPFKIVGVMMAYLMLAWLTTLTWHWAFFIIENRATARILKKSALVAGDNPIVSLMALGVTALCCASAATGVAIPFVIGGLTSCILVRLHRECLKKYSVVDDEPDIIVDTGWPSIGDPPRRLHPRNRSHTE